MQRELGESPPKVKGNKFFATCMPLLHGTPPQKAYWTENLALSHKLSLLA